VGQEEEEEEELLVLSVVLQMEQAIHTASPMTLVISRTKTRSLSTRV
jgi:hypothetical protein